MKKTIRGIAGPCGFNDILYRGADASFHLSLRVSHSCHLDRRERSLSAKTDMLIEFLASLEMKTGKIRWNEASAPIGNFKTRPERRWTLRIPIRIMTGAIRRERRSMDLSGKSICYEIRRIGSPGKSIAPEAGVVRPVEKPMGFSGKRTCPMTKSIRPVGKSVGFVTKVMGIVTKSIDFVAELIAKREKSMGKRIPPITNGP
uniref:Uncharacterized protein n=1 Tax=Candidatus Kentrum eta TaxID=2126337 RepID=A0A450UGG8_9GAMM|nr:MAG: hypothetical protein BECKH772A_GA0070896_1003314 [Candidatus Kentron sp. H]VFJ92691.1 MAG: hypothetical protein BECKH772B_GA0070898_1003214 [Candidatus Kentron sp. H]VFJ99488.1 MAG: hypothetical protein BECKH772C_GA0070978_1003214 [Candidatus Kentron sp. H]